MDWLRRNRKDVLYSVIVIALLGIILDSLPRKGRRILPLIIYLVMGWIILIALLPLMRELTLAGFLWLLIGGLLYSAGVIFYVMSHRRHFHGIWHLFVLGGSVVHYFTVLYYVR